MRECSDREEARARIRDREEESSIQTERTIIHRYNGLHWLRECAGVRESDAQKDILYICIKRHVYGYGGYVCTQTGVYVCEQHTDDAQQVCCAF